MAILRIEALEIHDFRCFSNIGFRLGKRITVIAGHNATGKSTILGLLGHCAELKNAKPILRKQFRTEFSEIMQASPRDTRNQNIYTVHLSQDDGKEVEPVSFRTTWQKWRDRKRFRIIPKKTQQRSTERKIEWPTLYLGLSRLYPIGESEELTLSDLKLAPAQKERFFREYKDILSMNEDPLDCSAITIQEATKKITVGIRTAKYEPVCNSAGQDNLSQILLAVMSFEALREQRSIDWNGGLLLIDELDATLHPAAQNKLVKYLFDRAKELGIQVVFTTHSLSLLDYVCEKCAHNNYDETNDFEIVYLTTRNGFLELIPSPNYETIYLDMLNTMSILSSELRTIPVYTEDDEARWMLRKMLGRLLPRVDMPNISMGNEQWLKLLREDYKHFKNMILVLDGDVPDKKIEELSKQLGSGRLPNVLKLPGGTSPERTLYDYLIGLPGTHVIFQEPAVAGLSKRSVKERGPDSYKGIAEREQNKRWFRAQEPLLEEIYPHWENDFRSDIEQFLDDFVKAFNQIAERIHLPRISECK